MRTLIYVPIIHSIADMGSLGNEIRNKSISGLGENAWQRHIDTVNGYWDAIESYFTNIDIYIRGIKIYQDGMFAEGEIGIRIVIDSIKLGSKNYEIVSKLIDRGAILMNTEDFNLVKEEYDWIQYILKSKNTPTKFYRLFRYKMAKSPLLVRRDKFIAAKIAETLGPDETGILFIGAYHSIKKRLPKDISVIELKEIAKVREYQRKIFSKAKFNIRRRKELAQYLIRK